MRSAAARRREGNARLRARPDLPAPARRIQPLLNKKRSCSTEWAERLANRTGWYGIQTRDHGVILVFLLLLRSRTYYIDMSNTAATGAPTCILDESFRLDRIQELPALEDMLNDTEVVDAWEFKVASV